VRRLTPFIRTALFAVRQSTRIPTKYRPGLSCHQQHAYTEEKFSHHRFFSPVLASGILLQHENTQTSQDKINKFYLTNVLTLFLGMNIGDSIYECFKLANIDEDFKKALLIFESNQIIEGDSSLKNFIKNKGVLATATYYIIRSICICMLYNKKNNLQYQNALKQLIKIRDQIHLLKHDHVEQKTIDQVRCNLDRFIDLFKSLETASFNSIFLNEDKRDMFLTLEKRLYLHIYVPYDVVTTLCHETRHPEKLMRVVVVRVWHPHSENEIGHASIQANDWYASLWPLKSEKSGVSDICKHIFHTLIDDVLVEERPADERIVLHNLSIEKMNAYMKAYKIYCPGWQFLSSTNNCASLSKELLVAGGIGRLDFILSFIETIDNWYIRQPLLYLVKLIIKVALPIFYIFAALVYVTPGDIANVSRRRKRLENITNFSIDLFRSTDYSSYFLNLMYRLLNYMTAVPLPFDNEIDNEIITIIDQTNDSTSILYNKLLSLIDQGDKSTDLVLFDLMDCLSSHATKQGHNEWSGIDCHM
jgi:hypothetical protein